MFQGFNQSTIQYWEIIRKDNSKTSFQSAQQFYLEGIKDPIEEMYHELVNYFVKADIEVSTKKTSCISSPYNDARFCGSQPMKEYIYVRFKALKAGKDNVAGFFFDASKEKFRYGIHIYNLNARGMERIRGKLLEDEKKSLNMIKAFQRENVMKADGVKYKKSCYPDKDEALRSWLEMRTLDFAHEEAINENFFQRKLLENMILSFDKTKEVFCMLRDALE